MTSSYSAPGRGAWTLTGGLLPAKPGGTGKSGYYRLNTKPELPVGSAWSYGGDLGHDTYVVNRAVVAIQKLADMSPGEQDGWFGPATHQAVLQAQRRWQVEADGIVGRGTMRAAVSALVEEIAVHNSVPASILGGVLVTESALDPGAVGTNGADHGLAQINLNAHGATVSASSALDPEFAIMFTASELAHTYSRFAGRTSADAWSVAIANHNSPLLAKQWARSGKAPFVAGRLFQIEDYVNRVRQSW